MKKWLGRALLAITFLVTSNLLHAQQCCDNAICKEKAIEYAKVISGLVNYLGTCSGDKTTDSIVLKKLEQEKPEAYSEFVRMVRILDDYLYSDDSKFKGTECFEKELAKNVAENALMWINHVRFHVLGKIPFFPSTEFCGGWKKRFEINQGSSAFLDKTNMSYLGSARAYLIYTFFKKDKCGGRFRIMAGPALFLRSRNSYLTLSTRLAYKLKDLKASVFSLGNLNLFGGYNSNFDGFNYAELGLEVELGPFGINIASNMNTGNGKAGFMVGVFLGNRKKSKTKK